MNHKIVFTFALLFLFAACQQQPGGQQVAASMSAPPLENYQPTQQEEIGGYTISAWAGSYPQEYNLSHIMGGAIVTITREEMEPIIIQGGRSFSNLIATDVTGEGDPDISIKTKTSGGNGCCYGSVIYNLGETPELLLELSERSYWGSFEDLNQDGVYEFVGQEFVPLACSTPSGKIILGYENGRYRHVGSRYSDQYNSDTEDFAARVAYANANTSGSGVYCTVVHSVLDYYYVGQQEIAWLVIEPYLTKE